MLTFNPNEETFPIKPVGVRYICEFCNDGEMIYDKINPPPLDFTDQSPLLYKHLCNKCGKIMHLPKIYPYIEWIKDEGDEMNGSD